MEVNLGFDASTHIRLEAILKLIDGTGTWHAPHNSETFLEGGRSFYLTSEKTRMYLDEPEVVLEEFRSYPDDIPGTHYITTDFAFKRTPLSPEATKRDQRVGSPNPRYQATEFSIILNDQDYYLRDLGVTFGAFHEFFLLADRFPAVEILRVISEMSTVSEYNFSGYMVRVVVSVPIHYDVNVGA